MCRGNFLSKTINVQTQIRPCKGDFFLKINKRAGQIPIKMQENTRAGRVSFQGVESLWVDCRFIPADWGS